MPQGARHAVNPQLLLNPIHFASLGFGTGLSRFAPGTMGTVAAIPIYLLMLHLPGWQYLALTLVFFLVGIALCEITTRRLGVQDHPAIVWDEIVGYLACMATVPVGWAWVLMGFVLFRVFDIWKPWPIGAIDRRVKGGLGIMLDDLIAALYAIIVMQAVLYTYALV